MRTIPRGLTGALPVAAGVLLVGLCAAIVSPAVRHGLAESFQRQPERYVELYFADESAARTCPAREGTVQVVATVRSHLAGPVAMPYVVTVAVDAATIARSAGVVGTTPGRAADFGAALAVPASAYTIEVALPGRPERLLVHCAGTDG